MTPEALPSNPQPSASWRSSQVYVMAAICLIVGVTLGYLFRGTASLKPAMTAEASTGAAPGGMAGKGMPTLEQMKHMADKQAEPLLAQLKDRPNDAALLIRIGDVYKSTHQFLTAADYYDRSLKVDPKNVGVRTDMASCLYYEGQVDQSLAQLEQSLKYDPKHEGTLFNLGMIRWKGKNDATGAVEAWKRLLALNPAPEHRAVVEKLIADASKHPGLQ
jgi:cytochrome c-type biogenesis protein CcmH/NrfG